MTRSFLTGFLIAPALLLVSWLLVWAIPDSSLEAYISGPHSVVVTDRHGEILQVLPLADGRRRIMTSLGDLPDALIEIFYSSEDERYYLHPGIDPLGLLRALLQNSREGGIVSGASTISMQLARIIRPHSGGVAGKIAEGWHALRLEAKLSKRRILELWLSSIPFGSQAEGVVAASREIFGLDPRALSVEQTLLLAVVPRRPADYDPRTNPEAAVTAALQLANRLGVQVTKGQLVLAAEAALQTLRETVSPWPFAAPHFVRRLVTRGEYIDQSNSSSVVTSLDLEMQDSLAAVLQGRVATATDHRIGNAAGIILDNRTGEVLAYVGSVDFNDESISGQIDGVTIRRQPGSTTKPFLYALAMENGFTPATILPDIPTDFGGEEIYVPENFNRRFNGPVRLRTALASSLNVPAVYTLQRLGVSSFADYLIRLGFDSIADQREDVGTGLALGNAEVSLLELARAFTVFVRDGIPITERYTPRLPPAAAEAEAVMSASTAGLIRSILSDRVGRITGFGTQSVLDTPFEAMFKTGTSDQFNNIWALGATADYTVGVWMGNFGGETVIGTPGSSIPAAAVKEVLGLFADPAKPLPPLRDVHDREICATSGGLATEFCPAVITEFFANGAEIDQCRWHTGISAPVAYPVEYQSWALQRGYVFTSGPGGERRPGGELRPGDITLEIISPADNAIFYLDPSVPIADQAIKIEVIADSAELIQLWANDSYLGEGISPLRVFLPLRPGEMNIVAVAGEFRADSRFAVK